MISMKMVQISVYRRKYLINGENMFHLLLFTIKTKKHFFFLKHGNQNLLLYSNYYQYK